MTVAYPHKFRGQLSAEDILDNVVRQREIHMITLNRYRFSEQRSCKDLTNLIEVLNGKITIKLYKRSCFGYRKPRQIAFLRIQKKSLEQIR